MARFGEWRPLTGPQLAPLTPDIICLHTMVASLAQADANFRRQGYAGTFSHFGVGEGGDVIQWQDTALRAAANYDGNYRCISVETADRGGSFPAWDTSRDDVPAWTDRQLSSLATLIAWASREHGIPIELVPDSRPGRRGVAFHRQGCDGNYPNGRVPNGELWSSARGKVCPGDRRIAQIPTVLDMARARLAAAIPVRPSDPEENDVDLTAPLPDLFTANDKDTIPLGTTIALACAHAAYARRDAAAALATVQRVEAKLDALAARLGPLAVITGSHASTK